jgi:hypothetical protein
VVRNHDRSRHGKKRFMSSMNDFVWAKDPRLLSLVCVVFFSDCGALFELSVDIRKKDVWNKTG